MRGSGQREELGERERAAPWEARGPVLLGVPQPFPPAVLWQGLLPLMELSVCPLEGSREHAFQITGAQGHGGAASADLALRRARALRLLSEPGR